MKSALFPTGPLSKALPCCLALAFSLFVASSVRAADPPVPAKKVNINFDSTGKFVESCGTEGTATASGLTAEQKAAIVAKVKAKFEAALGSNKVDVCEGTGGDVEVIVNGGDAPGDLAGGEYGDAGKPGKPCIVHVGSFAGCTGDDLVNAMSETITHEIGHKLGLKHNWDSPASVMTEGSKVPKDQRTPGTRGFNDDDKTNLTNTVTKAKTEQKDTIGPTDLGIHVGDKIGVPPNIPDDRHLDCYAFFLGGLPGLEFGYISDGGDFILQGDMSATQMNPSFMSFLYTAGADLAVRHDGTVYSLSGGFGQFNLNSPNPNNPAVFTLASIGFLLPGGSANLMLQAVMLQPHTGGFLVPVLVFAEREGNLMKISWNPHAADYQLVQATAVTSPTWNPVPVAPMLEQGRLVVRVPLPPQDPRRFFRLRRTGP